MIQVLILILILAVVASWWYRAAKRKVSQQSIGQQRTRRNKYHCVEVRSGAGACNAVKQLASIRFLSDQAPMLPLTGCTAEKCTCAYIHHDDRREDDRRNPYRRGFGEPSASVSSERRVKHDRRKSTDNAFRPRIII